MALIYSEQGMEILAKYGVEEDAPEVRRTALRCVANALLLDPKMRQAFVDTEYGGKLAEVLKVWRYLRTLGRWS